MSDLDLPSLGSDLPAVRELREWLFSERIMARCLWQITATKKNPRAIDAWLIHGRLVITTIAVYGWEIWTQPETNSVSEALRETERRIGLETESDGSRRLELSNEQRVAIVRAYDALMNPSESLRSTIKAQLEAAFPWPL